MATSIVDLPQVDLLNFNFCYVRPKRPKSGVEAAVVGREAADRATKSREVDLSRLKGFHLRFAPKTKSGVTCNWCLRLHLEVNRTCMRFSWVERANLLTLY